MKNKKNFQMIEMILNVSVYPRSLYRRKYLLNFITPANLPSANCDACDYSAPADILGQVKVIYPAGHVKSHRGNNEPKFDKSSSLDKY